MKDTDELISEPMQVSVLKNVVYGDGDVNGDLDVNLTDAILALQVLAGFEPQEFITDYPVSGVDVDGDDTVGLAEAIYVMQKVAGLRD